MVLNNLKVKVEFTIALAIVFIVNAHFLRLFSLVKGNVGIIGGDIYYEIIPIKLSYLGNLYGFTTDLGWPYGYSSWFHPLVGFGPQVAATIIGLLTNNLNIFFVYILCIIIGSIFNSVATYWAFKGEFTDKKIPISIAILVGICPFIIYRTDAVSLAWFYYPIIILGLWLKFYNNEINYKKIFKLTFIVGIFSPYWWSTVVLFISFTMLLIYLFKYKIYLRDIKFWFSILSSSVLSLIPGLFLYLSKSEFIAPSGRNPWQSNVFGGRLSDIFVTSPLLNQKLPWLSKLNEGVSPEAFYNQLGVVFLGTTIFALFHMTINIIDSNKLFEKNLSLLIFVILVYFIAGGLGNLQAAIFVLFDQISIARSWSRLMIFIGIIGIFLIFKTTIQRNLSKKLIYVISIIFLFLTILDLTYSKKVKIESIENFTEFAPVVYIKNQTESCPILQIPLDTYPIAQDFLFENGGDFAYNEFIPYLINDRNKWSVGAVPNNKFWLENISLPNVIDTTYANKLKDLGFCGILFDKDYASWQISRNAGINRQNGTLNADANWPGVMVKNLKADFENSRYQVFLLK